MPDNEWHDMLAAATGEVLETMFFTDVSGPAPVGASSPEPRVAARLSFEGTPSGALTLSVSEPAVRALAANFLGSEEDDPLPAAQLGSVVCELANMICGSLLSHVRTEEHFKLSSPELMPSGTACPPGQPSQSLSLGEDMGDGVSGGTIDLWLTLEQHAG
ncbi:MAG: chemotaxis protein CheX [Bryobacteraceae bacterium]|jgi:CheY-specific phosphatase CheX